MPFVRVVTWERVEAMLVAEVTSRSSASRPWEVRVERADWVRAVAKTWKPFVGGFLAGEG